MRRIVRSAVLVGLVTLVCAAPAAADDFCVTAPGQPAHADCNLPGDTVSTDLNDAVADANARVGPDRIFIGPGIHADPGAPAYAAADQDLVIDGSGRDATFMLVGAGDEGLVIVNDPQSYVSDLEIQMDDVFDVRGITLNDGEIERVDITGDPNGGTALRVLEGADARNVVVNIPPQDFPSNFGVEVVDNGSAQTKLTDVSARGTYGLIGDPGVTVHQDRGVMRGYAAGILLREGTTYTGDSFVARGLQGSAFAVSDFGGGSGDTAVDIRDATLWAHGSSQALNIYSNATRTIDVDVTSSMVERHGTGSSGDITVVAHNAGSVASLDLAYSWWSPSEAIVQGTNGGSATLTEGPGNVAGVDPGFVNAGSGDFRIFGDSPLVDAGDPAPLAIDESELDYLLGDRLLDGDGDAVARRDIGAEEFDPADPPPEPPADDQGGGSDDDGAGAPPPPPPVQPPVGPPGGPPVVVPPPPAELAPLSLLGGDRRVDRRRRVTFVIGCPAAAPGPCAGRVVLRTTRGRVLTLGRKAFTIAPGRTARVRFKVGRRGARALRRARRLRVRADVTAANASPVQRTFILRPARRRAG